MPRKGEVIGMNFLCSSSPTVSESDNGVTKEYKIDEMYRIWFLGTLKLAIALIILMSSSVLTYCASNGRQGRVGEIWHLKFGISKSDFPFRIYFILDAKWFGISQTYFGQYIPYLKMVWVPKPFQRRYSKYGRLPGIVLVNYGFR